MISLKITKDRLSNHFYYGKWYYIFTIIAVLVVFNLIYSGTAPKTPGWLKVDITLYSSYADSDAADSMEEKILAILPEDQKEVNIYSMGMGNEGGYSSMEIMAARIAAHEDDIIIVDTETALAYAEQGVFIPLDEYMSIDDIENLPEDLDLEQFNVAMQVESATDNNPHLYVVPLDGAEGMVALGMLPNGLSMGVTFYSENKENAIRCMQYFLEQTEYVPEVTE